MTVHEAFLEQDLLDLQNKVEEKDQRITELEMTVGTLRTFSNEQATCIERLEKENAELKEFVNAPHTKGRKTTRGDYIKTVWDLSKQLTKAKEIIKDLCGMVRELNKPNVQLTNVDYSLSEAEQFLKE